MKKEKITTFVKSFLPDILIQVGLTAFFVAILSPLVQEISSCTNEPITANPFDRYKCGGAHDDYTHLFIFFGIILASIGINMAIRRYITNKEKPQHG
jgi:hypothetical protein